LPYEEIDRILVFGEAVPCDDGKKATVVYPSIRDLAQRYGVAHSLIAEYSRRHNCMRRREVAQARVQAKTDQKIIELRSSAEALSKDETLRMIDSYLLKFEKAIADGRVRSDSPSDFNTMVRLKEYMLGGADSRREVQGGLSLEELQKRHRQMMKSIEASRGRRSRELANGGRPELVGRGGVNSPPSPSFRDGLEEVSGQYSEGQEEPGAGPSGDHGGDDGQQAVYAAEPDDGDDEDEE
jgi:hypothetical protein